MIRSASSLVCNLEIDFGGVQGTRILPFVVSLNLEDSILTPTAGQLQRFCYRIEGTGEDSSAYADLSHIVLGLCEEIGNDQIASATVTIDGVPQEVVLGDNVTVRSPDQPDPPTGCPGLKFDFGLNKVGGEMDLCFELYSTYRVGAMPVCVYGGGVTASGLYLCGPVCAEAEGCPAVGYQTIDVSVPVTVTPYATVGEVITTCCGTPTVTPGTLPIPAQPSACPFTITQRLCVAVPVEFGARAAVGTQSVECVATSGESCEDCAASAT